MLARYRLNDPGNFYNRRLVESVERDWSPTQSAFIHTVRLLDKPGVSFAVIDYRLERHLEPEQIDAGAAYLKGCASPDGTISGGYNWRRLGEICGTGEDDTSAGLALFKWLRALGRIRDLEPAPGTFSHSVFTVD